LRDRRAVKPGRCNPNSRSGPAEMDVIRTPGTVDPNAVSREHRPIGRPKRPSQRDDDWSPDRAKTANVGTIHMRERLRHRAANADDKKEPRERPDELHGYQHNTGVFPILLTG
jgi:hypothetical protein